MVIMYTLQYPGEPALIIFTWRYRGGMMIVKLRSEQPTIQRECFPQARRSAAGQLYFKSVAWNNLGLTSELHIAHRQAPHQSFLKNILVIIEKELKNISRPFTGPWGTVVF